MRGWEARTALTDAVPNVEELQRQILAGDTSGAGSTLGSLQEQTARAHRLTADPVWTLASWLPWAGANLAAVADVAKGVDDLADTVLPPMVTSAGLLDLSTMRPVNGKIELAPIVAAGPLISQASNAAARVDASVAIIDTGALLDVVATPVADVQHRVHDLALTLRTGERATQVLPAMLGGDGPRRYLVLLQSNAELRATGGLPGVLTVITADQGVIAMSEATAAGSMPVYDEPVQTLAPEDAALYSDRLGRYMGDVNLTPDFPTAAAIAAQMWLHKTGETVDGVLATDPVALSYLLSATGPVDDGTGGKLTAANAVDVLLSQAYSRYPDPADQNTFFGRVASNVFEAVASGRGSPGATVNALGKAAGEHRLLVWSTRADERADLAGTVLTGEMPRTLATTGSRGESSAVGVFFNDGTASKMDYYLETDVHLVSSSCMSGTATHSLHVTLTSHAPAYGATSLPASVTGPGTYGTAKGSITTNVVVLGALGGTIAAVERDGAPVGAGSYAQDGRPATTITVSLAPGASAVLTFLLTDPHPRPAVVLWTTPTRERSGFTLSDSGTTEC